MAKPWNEHRATITKLYIKEGRTLEDVRGIMKTEHNFEASIRSYRQHFDIWDIGKYNCKKRQQRRLQSLKVTPPAPLRSPALSSSSDTGSSPAWSCENQRFLEQVPLPAIQQLPRYAPPPYSSIHPLPALPSPSPPEPCIKIENGGEETDRRDVPMYQSAAPYPPERAAVGRTLITRRASQLTGNSLFRRNLHYTYVKSARRSAHWAPPPSTSVSNNDSSRQYCGSSYQCMAELPRHSEMASGLSSLSLSMVRGHWSHGALHPRSVSLSVTFHEGVASGSQLVSPVSSITPRLHLHVSSRHGQIRYKAFGLEDGRSSIPGHKFYPSLGHAYLRSHNEAKTRLGHHGG